MATRQTVCKNACPDAGASGTCRPPGRPTRLCLACNLLLPHTQLQGATAHGCYWACLLCWEMALCSKAAVSLPTTQANDGAACMPQHFGALVGCSQASCTHQAHTGGVLGSDRKLSPAGSSLNKSRQEEHLSCRCPGPCPLDVKSLRCMALACLISHRVIDRAR